MGAMGGSRLGTAMAMPSASTLCQLLALGLLIETRLAVLKQQQPEHDHTARRALEGDDGASFVTAAQAEAIVGEHIAG